jgi:hypothetical protein
MLRRALTLLSAGLRSAMVVTGCGVRVDDGPSVSSQRSVGSFERLDVQGSPDVDVRVGDQTSVVVRGDEDAVAQVRTVVRDGTLVVERDHHDDEGPTIVLGGHHLRVDVVVPRLTAVAVHGSGDVDLDLGSSPDDALDVTVQGSGDVSADGTVRALRASVQGSGDLDFAGLRAADADIAIQGSGDADVHADATLHAAIDGSGDISYTGDPQVTSDLEGSGNLSRDD